MHRRSIALALAVAFAANSVIPTAFALSSDDNTAIRSVVEAQLAALAVDDADRAFSWTTDAMHYRFVTAQRFLQLIREEFAVVYRPAAVEFLGADQVGGKVYQPVQLRDAGGNYWLAMYQVEQQHDGAWRINGSVLTKSRSQMH